MCRVSYVTKKLPKRPSSNVVCPLSRNLATSALNNFGYVVFVIGQCTHHFSCKDVSKVGKGLAPALELLIELLHQLDKLAGVNVGVARSLDVIDDLWRKTSR